MAAKSENEKLLNQQKQMNRDSQLWVVKVIDNDNEYRYLYLYLYT